MEREKLVKLVTDAQKGDSASINLLFNEFYNDVYYFALKTIKNEDIACDVTQETFVEIIRTISNLKEPAAFVTWMKQITYHQCTRYFKKKKDILVDEKEDENSIFDAVEEERAEFIPDEALDKKGFKETILEIVDSLSEEQRSAIMMYYFDELSIKEIAEIQGVSEGTVKSRLNYGRKAIKNSVEDYEKKNGVKLHAIPFFSFFKWVFEEDSKIKMATPAVKSVAKGVSAATKISVRVATGVGAKIAAVPAVVKVVSGVIAVVTVAGVVTIVALSDKKSEPVANENVSTIVSAEIVTESEEETTEISEELTEEATNEEEKTESVDKENKEDKVPDKGEEKNENETPPIVDKEILLRRAEEIAAAVYFDLPLFNDVSELSVKNVARFIYINYINPDKYGKTVIDDESFVIDVPVSDFNKYSEQLFGRKYNFKELDGQSMDAALGFGMVEITYNKSEDTLTLKETYWGGGGDGGYVFEAEKINDTNYVVIISYASTSETPPADGIEYETYVSDHDGKTYYNYNRPAREVRFVLVDGNFRIKSYVKYAD